MPQSPVTLHHPLGQVDAPSAAEVQDAVEEAVQARPGRPPFAHLSTEDGSSVRLHGPLLEVVTGGRRYRLDPRPLALAAMEHLARGEDPRGALAWYEVPTEERERAARRRSALRWILALLAAGALLALAWSALHGPRPA